MQSWGSRLPAYTETTTSWRKNRNQAEAQLRPQLDEQENRQRRKNLRVAGFPEGVEGNNAVAFLKKWLPTILGLPDKPEIERAHRMLRRKPQEGGMPRAFVIKFLLIQLV